MHRVDERSLEERDDGLAPRAPVRGGRVRALLGDRRAIVVGATAIALVPIAIAVVRVLIDHRFALNGDDSLIELRVRDVGSSHTPLVGSYGRYGFNQPGPLLFYLYAIPYRLTGSTFAGIQVACLLLAAAAIVAIAIVAKRRGGTGLLVWSLLLTTLLALYVPSHLTDPWEPYAVVLPLAALVYLAFDAAAGDRWALPFVVAVATLLAQAQPVTSPVAVALALLALVAAVVRAATGREPRWSRPLVVSAVVVVALWIPPLVDAVVHNPSNLQRLWDFLRARHQVLGLGDGYRVLALQLGVPAPWSGGSVVRSVFEPTLDLAAAPAVPIAVLVAAAGVVAAVRRRSSSVWFGVAALLAFVSGIVAMSRLVGPLYVWIPQWTRSVGMVCWAAGGWCLFRALPERVRERVSRPLLGALAVGLVVVGVAGGVVVARSSPPADPLGRAVLRLVPAASAAARAAHGPVLVRSTADANTPLGGSEIGVEVMGLALERRGVSFVVERQFADRFGAFRAQPGRARGELVIVPASGPLPAGYRLVASADPLSRSQRAERERITTELNRTLPDATLHQIKDRMRRDPHVRALVERLQHIPDLPPLALVARPLGAS